MKKYVVSRQVIFSQLVEVKAKDESDAILKAREIPYAIVELDFLDTDYYQVEGEKEEQDEWFELFTTLEDGSTMTVICVGTLEEAKEYLEVDPTLMVDQWRFNPDTETGEIIKYHNDLIN